MAKCCGWIIFNAGTVGRVDVSDFFDSPSHGANAAPCSSAMDFWELGVVYPFSLAALDPRLFS